MKKKKQTIGGWVEVFVDAVLQYGEFIFKDSRIANKHYARFIEALKQLNRFGDDGLSALACLLDDGRLAVRTTAACYLVKYRTDSALGVLREAAKAKDRAISMLAVATLRRWEMGYYLDPATGEEARCRQQK